MKSLYAQDRFWLVMILLAVTLLALPILTYPLGRDQGEFATIGRGILDGRVPYRDLWNPKPPAVFYVYGLAMTLFGRTTTALRAIDLLIVPLITLALYWLGKRIARSRVGLWAALIFPAFYFTETFWTLTQNDGIVLLPMTLAVVCLFKLFPINIVTPGEGFKPSPTNTTDTTSRLAVPPFLYAFLAGALGAYIVWFKYPFALFLGVLVLGFLFLSRPFTKSSVLSPQSFLNTILPFTLGILMVGGGGALYLMSIGAWDDLVESARVTSQYTALTFNLRDFGDLLGTALGFRWRQWGVLWVLTGVWLIVTRLGRRARGRGWNVVLLWLLAGLAIMLVQAKAYDYHWLPMLPPLVLLSASTLDWLITRLSDLVGRRGVTRQSDKASLVPTDNLSVSSDSAPSTQHSALFMAIAAVLFLAILANGIWPTTWRYLTGGENQVTYYNRFVSGAAEEFIAGQSLEVANLLRERVAQGDSLFIWGFRPEVYYMSGLNPAARFIFQFPLVGSWYPPEWRDELVDTLWAAMPPYALVLQVDYMPWVTGSNDDSNTLLQGYTELNNWLIANYERDSQIGNFFIWRRKP
jgi:hypothetical protein